MTGESNFETAEVGDWFERNRGVADHYKITEIQETFGERVRVVLETGSVSTKTDTDTYRIRVDEGQMKREFEPIEGDRGAADD